MPQYPGKGLPGGCLKSLKYSLGPFTLDRVRDIFMEIEHPREYRENIKNPQLSEAILRYVKKEADFPKGDLTIGEFYERLAEELQYLDAKYGEELWKGDPSLQVTAWGHQLGGKMVKVVDLFTALEAIDEVVKEGEGCTQTNPDDGQGELAHFFKFVELHARRAIVKTETGYDFYSKEVPFLQERDVVNMITLEKTANYEGTAKEANLGFNVGYNDLLNGLQAAFNGRPSRVPIMLNIAKDFHNTIAHKLPNGKFACPTFEQVDLESTNADNVDNANVSNGNLAQTRTVLEANAALTAKVKQLEHQLAAARSELARAAQSEPTRARVPPANKRQTTPTPTQL